MKHIPLSAFALIVLTLASLLPQAAGPAAAATSPGTIAYVRSQTGHGTDIRLIAPDGTNDRLVLTVADSPLANVPRLAWRPDAAELAFASDHAAATSIFEKDIYAVQPDGRGLRKLTNAPLPGQLAGYPKGTVTVDVVVGSSGPALVFLAGAAEPQTALSSGRLTFTNVADFGPGSVQSLVGIVGPRRWYGSGVDVQAGATIHATGALIITGAGTPRRADRPVWRSDGQTIGFMVGESCGNFTRLPINPALNAFGEPVLKASSFLSFLCLVDWGPTASLADQLLYNEWSSAVRGIYRKSEADSGAGELLLEYDSLHLPLDMKWLPDGSGFLMAVAEWREGAWASSNIYEYRFASRQLDQITSFDGELAGEFSIAPDGEWIVFERAPDMQSAADLWLMRRDASEMRLLVQKAGRPAWSRRAPQASPVFSVYVPTVGR
jgi:hypothetical protein